MGNLASPRATYLLLSITLLLGQWKTKHSFWVTQAIRRRFSQSAEDEPIKYVLLISKIGSLDFLFSFGHFETSSETCVSVVNTAENLIYLNFLFVCNHVLTSQEQSKEVN